MVINDKFVPSLCRILSKIENRVYIFSAKTYVWVVTLNVAPRPWTSSLRHIGGRGPYREHGFFRQHLTALLRCCPVVWGESICGSGPIGAHWYHLPYQWVIAQIIADFSQLQSLYSHPLPLEKNVVVVIVVVVILFPEEIHMGQVTKVRLAVTWRPSH